MDLSKHKFEQAYNQVILNNEFLPNKSYYLQYKPRYWNSLKYICQLPLPESPRILEIGGGQIALLCQKLFNYEGTVADLNEKYKQGILDHNLLFRCCDLLHDDLEERDYFDLVVMLEVIEHMPIPPYIVLEKIKSWIKPGGILFLTTPNLYRFRNLVRLAIGLPVFATFYIPDRGSGIGHPLEYSREHLTWQLEKAGFESIHIELRQLDNAGTKLWTQLGRIIASPFLLRPLWRDRLVVIAQKPKSFMPVDGQV